MNEFVALRSRARDKRDKAIAHARTEYEATLVQIATLAQDLLGRESSRHKKISACIESVIPRDRPFTTVDILAGLEAIGTGRVWRKRSIDNHRSRLPARGLVRRMRKSMGTEPAQYVRVGADVPKPPFEDMTLSEVIRAVLTQPMTTTELTVRILERWLPKDHEQAGTTDRHWSGSAEGGAPARDRTVVPGCIRDKRLTGWRKVQIPKISEIFCYGRYVNWHALIQSAQKSTYSVDDDTSILACNLFARFETR